MEKLAININDIRFKNPIISSAGPAGSNFETMKRAVDAGFAAITTKTICSSKANQPQPFITKTDYGVINNELWSDLSVKDWVNRELPMIAGLGVPIIVSIAPLSSNPIPEILQLARSLESSGAVSMFELPAPNPIHSGEDKAKDPIPIYLEIVKALKAQTDIPIICKISRHSGNLVVLAGQIRRAGASMISTTDTLGPFTSIDIETGKPYLGFPGHGGYSGPALRGYAISNIIDIAKSVDIPILGIGGVSNGKETIEMMMAGASLIGICSSYMENEYTIQENIQYLEEFLVRKRHNSLSEIIGSALQTFDDLKEETHLVAKIDTEKCGHCSPLMNYYVETLQNGTYCYVCGLCAAICPTNSISFDANGRLRVANTCINCGSCIVTCPRNYLLPKTFSDDPTGNPLLGKIKGIYSSRSTDAHIRDTSMSGGVATSLMKYCLDANIIEAALLTGGNDSHEGIDSFIEKDPSKIINYSSSRYLVNPHLKALADTVRDSSISSIGIVALPCQVLAIRKLQNISKDEVMSIERQFNPRGIENLDQHYAHVASLSVKIGPVIGLFCGGSFRDETYGRYNYNILELLKESEGKDKRTEYMLDPHSIACKTCNDYTSEQADISLGMKGSFSREGDSVIKWTSVIIRTELGKHIFEGALDRGYIELRDQGPDIKEIEKFALFKRKKLIELAGWLKGGYFSPKMRCELVCPWQAINIIENDDRMYAEVDKDRCHGCSYCTYHCPQSAITLIDEKGKPF